jgi:hypothetical protein
MDIENGYYNAPSLFRVMVENWVYTPVQVQYSFVPASGAHDLEVRVETVEGSMQAHTNTSGYYGFYGSLIARRSGRVKMQVVAGNANYFCPIAEAIAPLSGDTVFSPGCVRKDIAAAVLSRMVGVLYAWVATRRLA